MKKTIIYCCMFLVSIAAFAQTPNLIDTSLSPNGVLDKIFDQYGNSYKLSDIITGNGVRDPNGAVLKATNPTPLHCGYFDLYLEEGCGLNTTDTDYINRRNVVCQVFTDISNFINTPLTNVGNTTKVNIWVRDINNVITAPNSPVGVLGLASSFYNMPYNTTTGFGGIADNEIWKTIHTGVDSYTNVASPLVTSGISSGTSGVFYHGMMAFNFTDTTTPINWNTSLTATSFPNLYDLYSVMLHEVTHALGFASLINDTGGSKFGAGYNYYSRYDRFLKNNANTQFLLTNTGACNTMYNYVFNSALTSAILHPTTTPYCSNTIRFVGASNVPVYTPSTFAAASSLSHFEDLCVSPNIDNAYFVMSDAIGKNVIKRFLKPQERTTLGDLGYSVKTTFGTSTTYQGTTTYTGTITGIPVAGINDGINTNGTYKYIGLATTASPIVINSSTDTTRRILSNDIGYAGFECLQDIFDSTARFNGTLTSVTSLTNPNLDVTFTSAVTGIHLLRYVPVNGTLRGNITYIYVYVEPNNSCGTPTACNLIINGDFEQHSTLVSGDGLGLNNFASVCNWSRANTQGTPDYFSSDCTNAHVKTPCNLWGVESDNIPTHKSYAGLVCGGSSILEPIKTSLSSALLPNTNYQLSFDVSLAEGSSAYAAKLQAYFSTTSTTYPGYANIPIANTNMLFASPAVVNTTDGWQKITFSFTTGSVAGENTLYIGGLNNPFVNVNTPSPQGINGCSYFNQNNPTDPNTAAYYFIDNVSLIPLNGGSFTLPAYLCLDSQSIPNLNAYLNSLPTNGVFSGLGVSFNGTTYTLNEMFDMNPGINTISYTYTNLSGCSVTVYSNINVVAPLIPTISGSTLAYSTAPNNTTVNTTTIPAGYTAVWSITGGTGTITTANNAALVGVTWTSLPGQLTLTLTNTASGCVSTATKTIYNQASCDCLNTINFTYTQTSPRTATFLIGNSVPGCTSPAYIINYGDGTFGPPRPFSASHTYAFAGTYTVTITGVIKGEYDQAICSGTPYTATVTVTNGGKVIIGPVDTGKQSLDNHVTIYPNPASSVLNFDVAFTQNGPLETIIRTVDGKELMRKQWDLQKGKHDLQLELPTTLSDGMIFVEIISDEVKETRTVLIKR